MPQDKSPDSVTRISKADIDVILEVNKKAIQIQTEVASQNEEILESLSTIKEEVNYIVNQDKINLKQKLEKIETNTTFVVDQDKLNIKKKIEDLSTQLTKTDANVEKIDKSLFKLYVFLSAGMLSLVLQIIQFLISLKK